VEQFFADLLQNMLFYRLLLWLAIFGRNTWIKKQQYSHSPHN
jgi:hypothetical protein